MYFYYLRVLCVYEIHTNSGHSRTSGWKEKRRAADESIDSPYFYRVLKNGEKEEPKEKIPSDQRRNHWPVVAGWSPLISVGTDIPHFPALQKSFLGFFVFGMQLPAPPSLPPCPNGLSSSVWGGGIKVGKMPSFSPLSTATTQHVGTAAATSREGPLNISF